MASVEVKLGNTFDGRPVVVPDHAFWLHTLLVAPTGYGKTYLLAIVLLQLAMVYGMLVPDRVGTLSRLLTNHLAAHWDELSPAMRQRIIILRPSGEPTFSLDPFLTPHVGKAYYQWLHRRVESVMRYIARKQGQVDYKEQNRRGRVMRLVLYLAAIRDPSDPGGKYYGLHRVMELLDIGSPAWDRMYRKRRPFLPPTVRTEWDRLRRLSPHARNLETESTRNFFDQFLASDRIREMVAPGRPPLDPHRCIRGDAIVIVDLSDNNQFFSPEEADAVASLLLTHFIEAARVERRRYILVLEEVEKLLHEDLGDFLARSRNANVACFVVAQDLSSFKNRFADISSKAVSQPNLHCTFFQRDEEGLRVFSRLHGTASLDFSPNLIPMDRPDGFDVVTLAEPTVGQTATTSEEDGFAAGREQGRKREISAGTSISHEKRRSHESGKSASSTDHTQQTDSDDFGDEITHREIADERQTIYSDVRARRSSRSTGQEETQGSHESTSAGQSWRQGRDRRTATADNSAETFTARASQSRARSRQVATTSRHHLRPRYREERYPHGLRFREDTQYAMVQWAMRRLGPAQMLLGWGHRESIFVNVARLDDPFAGRPKLAAVKVRQLLEHVHKSHDFYFVPEGPEPCRLTGAPATNGCGPSSTNTPRTPNNGSARESSTLTRLLHDVRRSLPGGGGTASASSEESS